MTVPVTVAVKDWPIKFCVRVAAGLASVDEIVWAEVSLASPNQSAAIMIATTVALRRVQNNVISESKAAKPS